MSTKPDHQTEENVCAVVPATPLPFRLVDMSHVGGVSDRPADHYWSIEGGCGYLPVANSAGFCIGGWITPADARYIVHAANAYPTLVAALIDALEYIEPYSDVIDGNHSEQLPNRAMSLSGDIERLLQALGELK